jgi:hypothetical protein
MLWPKCLGMAGEDSVPITWIPSPKTFKAGRIYYLSCGTAVTEDFQTGIVTAIDDSSFQIVAIHRNRNFINLINSCSSTIPIGLTQEKLVCWVFSFFHIPVSQSIQESRKITIAFLGDLDSH